MIAGISQLVGDSRICQIGKQLFVLKSLLHDKAWQQFQAVLRRELGVQQASGLAIEQQQGFVLPILAGMKTFAECEHSCCHVSGECEFATHDRIKYNDWVSKMNGFGWCDVIGCGG